MVNSPTLLAAEREIEARPFYSVQPTLPIGPPPTEASVSQRGEGELAIIHANFTKLKTKQVHWVGERLSE